MQAAGCNTLLNYYYENVGWMLDRAAERNLKLWVHLGWMSLLDSEIRGMERKI